jgi:REP element-mobilizing transposase RayT
MLNKAEVLGCPVHAIGGVEDHVHVLFSLPSTQAISSVVKELKGASSRIVSLEYPDRFFKWQGTYGALSVSPAALPAVTGYIQNQADHHNRGDLKDSFETVEMLYYTQCDDDN